LLAASGSTTPIKLVCSGLAAEAARKIAIFEKLTFALIPQAWLAEASI
jgi:hypothetical protein